MAEQRRKLFSRQVELRVIRTICMESESRAAQDLLAKLTEAHFASEIARASYKRILHRLQKTSSIPEWHELISDPGLDETVREDLEAVEYEPLVTKKRTRRAIQILDEYYKLRLLGRLGKHAARILNSTDPVSVDDELAEAQNIIANARSSKNFKVLRIGTNSNARKHVDKLLKGQSITYIPTGFKGFDDTNRGIPAGSFMLVAGPTGSGKSALLNCMLENMARYGAKVGIAPLEMANDEMLQRNLARVGQMDMTKLLDPVKRINRREHAELREAFDRYDRKIEKAGGAMEFYEFDEEVSIQTITSTVRPYKLDVLGIDYLGLLEGVSGDNAWQALMNVARFCHVWGKANGTSVIAAAQLSEDGMLRYSRGLAEHAKYFWSWTIDDIAKSTGIVTMKQRKARQASDHDFMLKFDLATMTIVDATAEAIRAAADLRKERKQPRGAGNNSTKNWKNDNSLSWDEEDSETPAPRPGPRAINKKPGGKRRAPKEAVEL